MYLAFIPPLIYSDDGNSMLAVAESLVAGRGFTVPAAVGRLGRGGHYYSIWYPLQSILDVPFVALGNATAHVAHLPSHYVAGVLTSLLSVLMCTGSVYLTGMLALRLGASTKGAILAAMAFGLGTITPVYARDFFADPALTLMTAATLFFALGEGTRQSATLVVAAGLAVLSKPSGIILGPLVSAYKFFKTRELRQAIIPLAGTAAGSLLFLLYNDLRFGSFTNFGYEKMVPFTTRHFLVAAVAMLVSPGRGILWYCPPILGLAGLKRTKLARPEVVLILAVAGAYWLMYSCWYDWAGGWAWGPRFLLVVLPGLMALTGLLSERWLRIMPVLILLGFISSAPNLICFFERYQTEGAASGLTAAQEIWSPSKSPLVGIWRVAYHQVRDARVTDVARLVQSAGKPDLGARDWRAFRIVAVWWWMLPVVGIPRFIGAAVALLLVGFGAMLIAYSLRCAAPMGKSRCTSADQL